MTESEFLEQAEVTILAIEDALDECDTDIDFDTVGDVLTMIFENGSQIIINKQTPLKQIWVAARSGGYHFDWADDDWVLDSDHTKTLSQCLNQYCSEHAGESVDLGLS